MRRGIGQIKNSGGRPRLGFGELIFESVEDGVSRRRCRGQGFTLTGLLSGAGG